MKIEIFLLLSNWSELMEECLLFDKSWILSLFTFPLPLQEKEESSFEKQKI